MTNFTGTSGDDSQVGSAGDDHFDFSQGGHDTLIGGGGGTDVYYFGGALDAGDEVIGGAGCYDRILLEGDYSHGLTLDMARFSEINEFDLAGTAAYRLTLTGAMATSSSALFILSQTTGEVRIDVSGLTGVASVHAEFNTLGTHGSFTGGAGDDVVDVSHQIGKTERLDGGAGSDQLDVFVAQEAFHAGAATLRDIEALAISGEVRLADGNVAAGHVLSVTSNMGPLDFDGHKETDGAYAVTGNTESDTLTGGKGADTLTGGGGDDLLTGGKGADVLTGGAGNDTFVYRALTDSTRTAFDTITDLASGDTIDLSHIDADAGKAGNQAFKLVGSFTHHAGELVLTYDAGDGFTVLAGDVDGDGKADLMLQLSGDESRFAGLVL